MALDAEGVGQSSTSPGSATRRWKYHVFLSFRGEDTRTSFTDHLYVTLQRGGIITFRDDEELGRGQVIKESLLQAIQQSLYAIVVLSPNYASSTWCLDELVEILHAKKELGLQVFPIFYGVDPSDVRHQRGCFAEALKKHEEKFTQDKMKVQRWRDALEEVANLSGWHWHSGNRHETEFIENITEEVMSKLRDELPFDFDMFVGIESKIAEFQSVVANELEGIQLIGIWGMGGLGKTTLARVFYERMHKDFEVHCFLHNVREICERGGLVSLQRKLLFSVNKRNIEVCDCDEGRKLIKNMLCNRKILLILDDVSNISQIENLAGKQEWFGEGSRIIITTRDKHLLSSCGVSAQYQVKFLSNNESLELFHQYAFKEIKENKSNEHYLELSRNVIKYAGGLPLALKVLGSFLCGRNILQWNDALDRFKKVPPYDILKILEVSFDGLENDVKIIFLDIACFFNGKTKNNVIQILEKCDLHPVIGIDVLLEKSLVIEDKGCLWVHDMLQEMGKNIIVQESPNDAGKRSRIFSLEDANHILELNKGTEAIRGIVLTLDKSSDAFWNPEAFLKMSNLRLLIISSHSRVPLCQLNLPHGLECLSSTLKVIEWKGYPLDSLPGRTLPHDLVDLKMRHSKLKGLWRGTQLLRRLKSIDLSHSKNFIKTPNFEGIPLLERLILKGCSNLVEVHPSLGQHKNLVILNMKDCKSIKILPRKFEMDHLETFVLSGCLKVRRLPEFGKDMKHLSLLDLEETAIAKLPQSLGNLVGLATLNLGNCKNLVCLPNNIHKMKALKILEIFGCSKFSRLAENLNENEAVEELDVSGTAIKEVPPSLNNLKELKLSGCNGQAQSSSSPWKRFSLLSWAFRLQRPSSATRFMFSTFLSGLSSLEQLNLSYCNLHDGSLPNDISGLSSLAMLNLSGNNFVDFPSGPISSLSKLQGLFLDNCQRLQSLPQLPSNLLSLFVSDCPSMEHYVCSQLLWEFVESFQSQGHNPRQLFCSAQDDIGECKLVIFCSYLGLISWDLQIPDFFMQPVRMLTIPGSEVPSWFYNQNYFCEEEFTHDEIADTITSNVSFIVKIPDSCRSSEWWGIATCLVLENDEAHDGDNDIVWWTYRCPKDEFPKSYFLSFVGLQDNCHHQLLLVFIRCSSFVGNQLQMLFFTSTVYEELAELKIRKCGWRVVCKEDVERWRKTREEGCRNNNNDNVLNE